jgi:integrase
MPRRLRIPSYRLHKQSGQAVVTLPDGFGGRRDVLLGPFDSAESWDHYHRVIAEWKVNGRRLPLDGKPEGGGKRGRRAKELTVNELILAYYQWAEAFHGWTKQNGQAANLRDALRVVKDLYGTNRASQFGPLALKACRARMIEAGWCRTYVNAQVQRVCRMFRWAASEELLPGSIYENLKTVEGLRRGKTEARESAKVRPVETERVEATLPYLRPILRAMVRIQQLTGCRPSEVCLLRPIDIDMRNPNCWVYRPTRHKNEHHDHERLVLIGPRAQEVLRPYLGTRLDAYCFSPATSEQERRIEQRRNRRTPMTPSQERRQPERCPKRPKRDHYDETSYRNAVYRACERAFPAPEPLARRVGETTRAWQERLTPEQKEQLASWRATNRWHPNQLRHSRATELRRHGLDLVKTILGHSKVETSQIYAEKDLAAAMELVAKIG